MKCPKCGSTDDFYTDMWELNWYAGHINDRDMDHTYNDILERMAIDPKGKTHCQADDCNYLGATQEFLNGEEPFTVQELPDPDLPGVKLLVRAILELLACPDLNLDELENVTQEAVKKARSLVRPPKRMIHQIGCEKGVAV